MTREEEIQEKAMRISKKHILFCGLPITECIDAVLEMAEWVDEHPRKGLWESEKVIKWLRTNIDNYANYNVKTDECFVNDFEEDLLKAMED